MVLFPHSITIPDDAVFEIRYDGLDADDKLYFCHGDDAERVRECLKSISVRRLYLDGGQEFPETMGAIRADDFIRIFIWDGVYNSDTNSISGGITGHWVLFLSKPEKSVYIPFDGWGYRNKSSVTKESAVIVEELCKILIDY